MAEEKATRSSAKKEPEESAVPEQPEQPEPVFVTVGDEEIEIGQDLLATAVARANASTADHEAHQEGYSNFPNRTMTEEEAEEDQKAWEKRFAKSG
jgi:hypothetical protein